MTADASLGYHLENTNQPQQPWYFVSRGAFGIPFTFLLTARRKRNISHIIQTIVFESLLFAVVSFYPVVMHNHDVLEMYVRVVLLVREFEELFSIREAISREILHSQTALDFLVQRRVERFLGSCSTKQQR